MTKRNKLYARLIYGEAASRCFHFGNMHPEFTGYVKFLKSQARKNNPYAMALRQIGG